jgi:hypothetical protein
MCRFTYVMFVYVCYVRNILHFGLNFIPEIEQLAKVFG